MKTLTTHLVLLLFAVVCCQLSAHAEGTELDYVMQCIDYGADAVRRDIKVRFQDADVYFQGLSEEVPEAWVHATIVDGTAVFDVPQYLGEWTYYGAKRKQYFAGADTNTGDVSGFEMIYDDVSRSFTSFSHNWMFLTPTPGEMNGMYDHLYNSITLLPASQAGGDPTVTPPAGLATTTYQLQGRHPYSGIPTDYTVSVGYAGSEVYVQGLYPAFPNAWVKGTVADGTAAFSTPQYVGNYHGLYNMYVAGVDVSTEELRALTMRYDEATHTFTSTPDLWFIVQAGETNLMPMMLLDEVTIAPYTPPVVDAIELQLPLALQEKVVPCRFSAIDADTNAPVSATAAMAIDGSDVYLRGISSHFPDVWVKGQRQGVVLVFPRNQYMGVMQGNNIYLGAGDAMSGEMLYGNFILLHDTSTGEYVQPEVNYLAINASTTKVYHLEMYKGVRLTPILDAGILSASADGHACDSCYDLQGRSCPQQPHASGLYIVGGKKLLAR